MTKLKDWTKTLISGSALLLAAAALFNLINYAFVLLMGKRLTTVEFGTLALMSNLLVLTLVPSGALAGTLARYISYFDRTKRLKQQAWLRHRLFKLALILSLGSALVFAGASVPLQHFFRLSSPAPFLWFLPAFAGVVLLASLSAVLQGYRLFTALAALFVFQGLTKLGFAFVSTSLGFGLPAALTSYTVSIALTSIVAWRLLPSIPRVKSLAQRSQMRLKTDTMRYFKFAFLSSLGLVMLFTLDVLLAKHLLDPEAAGRYALLSLFGKVIMLSSTAIASVTLPMIAHAIGIKRNLKKLTNTSLMLIGALVGISVAIFATAPQRISALLVGEKSTLIAEYLPRYAFAVGLLAIGSYLVRVQLVKKRYAFAVLPLICALALVLLLVGSPASLSRIISSYQLITGGFFFLAAIAYLIVEQEWHVRDLLDIITTKTPDTSRIGDKRYILIFNWRDTKHAWAGGAEVYVHELAKRWVKMGHHVTVFCGNDRKSPRNEVIDGVQIVRRGGFFTVYFWAFIYYILRFRGRFDVILDCENGIPFFTPLYVRIPKYLVIYHVHQDVFRENLITPFSWIAQVLESKLMPLFYRNCEVITISQSSKKAIMRHALTGKIPSVIHSGIDLEVYKPGKKSENPLIIYVGRLKQYKNLPVLIQAMKILTEKIPRVRLVIAGFGDEQEKLKELVDALKLSKVVTFAGKVSEEEKIRLYQKAWVAVNPSTMEGWGMTAIEANACGTPVVASDVPGLRDSVQNPHSGFLVDYQDPDAFADSIFRIVTNRRLREDLSEDARAWANKFRWEKSAERFLSLFEEQSQPSAISHQPLILKP